MYFTISYANSTTYLYKRAFYAFTANFSTSPHTFFYGKKKLGNQRLTIQLKVASGFFINIIKSKTKVGRQVFLMFSIAQHSRDAVLLRYFRDFLDCGNYYPSSTREEGNFSITKFSDIELKIIPPQEL